MTITLVRRPNGKIQRNASGKLTQAPCPCDCEPASEECSDCADWSAVTVDGFGLTQGLNPDYEVGGCGSGSPVTPGVTLNRIWYGKDGDVQHWVWCERDQTCIDLLKGEYAYHHVYCDTAIEKTDHASKCCKEIWTGTVHTFTHDDYVVVIY